MVAKERIVIFGAGAYGREALHYYGARNVAAFVDNDKTKKGQYYCGKPILSFEELCEDKTLYKVIVAIRVYQAVLKQLQENGFKEYSIYDPQYIGIIEQLDFANGLRDKCVVLFGIEDYAGILLDALCAESQAREITVSDVEGSKYLGLKFHGHRVVGFPSVKDRVDVVIVASKQRAYALKAYLGREKRKETEVWNPFVQQRYYPPGKLLMIPDNSLKETTEEQYAEDIEKNFHKNQINGYFDELNKQIPLFEHIEIETVNRCNGTCDFCPVSAGNDIREKRVMEDSLFKSIIDQLAELDYSGRLATFSNNEPFLDPRIIEFNKYARKKLSKARIHLFTNASLLTLEKFIAILPYLDELIIDNYNQKLELNANPRVIYDYCKEHPETKEKVTIVLRKEREILTSRGGDAPNRKMLISYKETKCVNPLLQIIVRPDGKVSLCCNDPYGRMTLGDVSKEKLVDIWYGEEFFKVRRLLDKGRAALEHCKYCDTFNVF